MDSSEGGFQAENFVIFIPKSVSMSGADDLHPQLFPPGGGEQGCPLLFPGQFFRHMPKAGPGGDDLHGMQVFRGVFRNAGDEMACVEVIRMGMGLQKAADFRGRHAVFEAGAGEIRPQVDENFAVDKYAGALAEIFAPCPSPRLTGRTAAEGQRRGRGRGSAQKQNFHEAIPPSFSGILSYQY